ncbi:hypothetical protein RJ639_046990 [Escallonia herrerae]|uniref:Uncharacterized protein n=1 Tax=Escallonia herrerae TaxID=1293975 RepID=A0AA89B0M9_9ASTE|nr:hypothetical protein RJ639_046990 [Escallonia herrerae]
MADASDHESALLLGFKRSPDELPTNSNSFHPDESHSLGSPQKKSKCSSSNAVVHEDSQEIKGDKLGSSENGAVIKLDGLSSALTGTQESKEGELGSRIDVVTEQDIARYEKKGFCGIQEFGKEAKEKEQLDSKNDVVTEEQDFAKDEKSFSGIQEFVLNEKEQYLAKYKVVFPRIEETGKPKTLYDVVAESFCGSLGVNGPEQLSDSVTQVVKLESSKGILGEYVIGDGKIELIDDTALIENTGVNGWDPLKIEVLDDTALVQTVSKERGSMGAANYPKWNGDQKNVKQEMDGKNEKRSRKRGGKGRKKRMVEAQNGFQKKGSGSEHVYSMKEMEALRFVNVDEQRKKWIEVYCGLGPAVVGEYDGLVDCNYQKQFEVNFDPRQQFRRKEAAHATCGASSFLNPLYSFRFYFKFLFENFVNCDEVSDNMDLGFQSMDTLDPAHGLSCSHKDGCTAEQEECIEDDEGDAGYSSILRPAFLVKGEPNFDSGPPQDGLEFIRRVRISCYNGLATWWEAERIPNVKVAKVERSKLKKEQTIYMPRIPDIPKCPEQLMPLKQWEDAFLADFSELRLNFTKSTILALIPTSALAECLPISVSLLKICNGRRNCRQDLPSMQTSSQMIW